jgi:DNA polymerase III sliding clamp (beta) subunit (PCNA family)
MWVYTWENLPDCFKELSIPKKKPFPTSRDLKPVHEIFKPFLGTDELRPVMSGYYQDKEHIVATDAHKLFALPVSSKGPEKIVEPLTGREIEGRFPNWKAVVPTEHSGSGTINVNNFILYVLNANLFSNKTTHQVLVSTPTKDNPSQIMGFNARFLLDALRPFQMLGIEKVKCFWSQPNRAMLITVPENKGRKQIFKHLFTLIMPVLVNVPYELEGKEHYLAAEDPDFKDELTGRFNLKTGKIDLPGKSVKVVPVPVTKFKEGIPNTQYNALRTFFGKSNKIPVLDYFCVKSGYGYCVNSLNEGNIISLPVNWKEGLYSFTDRGPLLNLPDLSSNNPLTVDDFITLPELKTKEETTLELSSKEFFNALDYFNRTRGKDELRPALSGLIWQKNYLASTDAYAVTFVNVPKYYPENKESYQQGVSMYGLDVMYKFRNMFNSGPSITLQVDEEAKESYSGVGKWKLTYGNFSLYGNLVDAKPPVIDAILPGSLEAKFQLEQPEFKKVFTELRKYDKEFGKTQTIIAQLFKEKVIFGYYVQDKWNNLNSMPINLQKETVDIDTYSDLSGVWVMPSRTLDDAEISFSDTAKKVWTKLKDFVFYSSGKRKVGRVVKLDPIPESVSSGSFDLELLNLQAEAIKIKFAFS